MESIKTFVLEDYDIKKTFSSFLPGLAGLRGIPMWVYYCNRGQCITSVGSKDKNGAIIEYNPACTAYEKVNLQGFRTFIKANGKFYEAFSPRRGIENLKRYMYISEASFSIEEINYDGNYKLEVKYFGLPNMPIGGLVRRVKLTSLIDQPIEIVDGSSQILSHGISNGDYKDIANLIKSWIDVYHIDDKTPFYTMRSSSADESEVTEVVTGNYYLSKYNNDLLKVICDLEILFGYDSSRMVPINLLNHSFEELLERPQYVVNKIPCAFVGCQKHLSKDESLEIDSMLGFLPKYELLVDNLNKIMEEDFFNNKEKEASKVVTDLTDDVETVSNYPMFDEYIRQSYLDNFLRGGYPVNLGSKEKPIPYYIYSRKHGDPERDYNWFNLEPEYYSQGNGNFRDVNQNRRSDVIINGYVGSSNVKLFMNLVGLDGYNPLVINGSTFTLNSSINKLELSQKILGHLDEGFIQLLNGHFTPGGIINYFNKQGLVPLVNDFEIFDLILQNSEEHQQAVFGEGYWIDHFTYNLDLIESYLWVYPDKEKELLFDDYTYRYYFNPIYVLPRSEKIGLTKSGLVRQYGSIIGLSKEEKEAIDFKNHTSNWVKKTDKSIYQVNLGSKLVNLIYVKYALRDPLGYGINMESDKPGWNDAMNGLPGLMSSGVSESLELFRILNQTISSFEKYPNESIIIHKELSVLIDKVTKTLSLKQRGNISEFEFYNLNQEAIETYRANLYMGIISEYSQIACCELIDSLKLIRDEIKNKIVELSNKFEILPTYLIYDCTKYEKLEGTTPYGLDKVKVLEYQLRLVPSFLEAPARYLKCVIDNAYDPKKLYERIKRTDMYDEKLKIYRTSVDLDNEKMEIGRIRAFTKGWLERESDFMHMTFKYLYGLLKSHLYDEFFDEIKTNFSAFMDKEVYGRSVFENSSFIATSVNPNPNLHGMGFVARLSGSNTEVISMWLLMMFGHLPFSMREDGLHLQLKPILSKDYFKDGVLSTRFLKDIEVVYVNLQNKDTYDGLVPVKYELQNENGIKTVLGSELDVQDSLNVRNKLYSRITVYLGSNKF